MHIWYNEMPVRMSHCIFSFFQMHFLRKFINFTRHSGFTTRMVERNYTLQMRWKYFVTMLHLACFKIWFAVFQATERMPFHKDGLNYKGNELCIYYTHLAFSKTRYLDIPQFFLIYIIHDVFYSCSTSTLLFI